jgi:hypothetical protein
VRNMCETCGGGGEFSRGKSISYLTALLRNLGASVGLDRLSPLLLPDSVSSLLAGLASISSEMKFKCFVAVDQILLYHIVAQGCHRRTLGSSNRRGNIWPRVGHLADES